MSTRRECRMQQVWGWEPASSQVLRHLWRPASRSRLHARGAVRTILADSAFVTSAAANWARGPRPRSPRARRSPRHLRTGGYTLGRLLGEGAGKRVYLATDTRLQREVAAAVFKAGGSDETAMRRARTRSRGDGEAWRTPQHRQRL